MSGSKCGAGFGSEPFALVRVIRVRQFMSALIIAFDGLLADTLDLRADAVIASLHAEGKAVGRTHARDALPGRSLFETVELLAGPADQTLVDLVTIRAQRAISMRMSQGVTLLPNAREWIDAQRSAGARLVLRADSLRRDVERVLQLTDLEFAFTFVRCTDDLPRTPGASSLESAYAAISRRLDGLRVSGERIAYELNEYAAAAGREHLGVSPLPSSVSRLPSVF